MKPPKPKGKRGGYRPGGGRPKGRLNKATHIHKVTLSDLARQYTPDAVRALVKVCKTGKSESARVTAAAAILDRGYGRPFQSVQHSGSIGHYDLTKVPDEQLDQLEAILGQIADDTGDQSGTAQTSH